MEEKICPSCDESKPVTEFAKNRSKADGRQSHCNACKSARQAVWYRKHSAQHRKNVQRRRERVIPERYALLDAYVRDHPCVDCGETDPIVLEFDHVRGTKAGNVSVMVQQEAPWDRVLEEIAKCDVRCANCHRRKTAKERWTRRPVPERT